MVIINKRIITNIVFSIILGASFVFIGINSNKIIPTSSIPVSKHTIVLDAGHGQPDRTAL